MRPAVLRQRQLGNLRNELGLDFPDKGDETGKTDGRPWCMSSWRDRIPSARVPAARATPALREKQKRGRGRRLTRALANIPRREGLVGPDGLRSPVPETRRVDEHPTG